jgi:uncharacterized tellurite resistance protein B-like protein
MSLLKFFGIEREEESTAGETDSVRKITEALDRFDPEHARYVAAFAYVLSRVARADLHVSEIETEAMKRIIIEHGKLSEEEAAIAVEIAKSQNRMFGFTEDFVVTRELGRMATREQKLLMLDSLFAVSAAEGMISHEEDNEIRRISRELVLEHRDFIQVRSAWRDQLSILRRR